MSNTLTEEPFEAQYWSGIARGLACCAILMTVVCGVGVVLGGALKGNLVGMFIFGGAAFLLLKAARAISAERN